MSRNPLLSVRGLTKHYPVTQGVLKREVGRVRAVDGIGFDQFRAETLGLVGETGSGKSTAARCLLRIEEPTGGAVSFDGEDVLDLSGKELKRGRRRTAMVFQDATSSFDPRTTVGESVAEPLRVHGLRDRARRRSIVEELIDRVGLSASDFDRYPHEFSGGQKQRLALARALVVNPDLIVADEPVSALDVSVQASILSLMEEIQQEFDLSILFISHDIDVVQAVCDRVAVMYLGRIVELGSVEAVLAEPQHPYTRALIASIPKPDPRQKGSRVELGGEVPDPANPPPGCHFHPRCPEVIPPEGSALEPEEWRAVMALRVHLREEGIDLAAVKEFVGLEASDREPTKSELQRAIREEFGLSSQLSDPRARAAVTEALDEIVEGRELAAAQRLAAAFPTVCVSEDPSLRAAGHRGEAACHLVDM